VLRAQRVIQVLQAVLHPHFAPTVLEHAKPLERPLALGGIRRQRRDDEPEAIPPVGVLRARELGVENLLPAGHLAHGKLHRHRDLVGLGQRQAWHALVAPPHPFEPRYAVRRRHGVAIGVEPRGLLTLRRGTSQAVA
jgi:hypothetical protein